MAHDVFRALKQSKWAIPIIVAVLAVALTAGRFLLFQTRGQTGLLASPSGGETGAASEVGGGDWPKYSEVKTFAVTYPQGAVHIPDDAVRFTPRGIATIKTSDGQSFQAIANTMLLHTPGGGAVKDGLYNDDTKEFPILFSDMEGFSISRAEGASAPAAHIRKSGGDTRLLLPDIHKQLIFMNAGGDQEGQILPLDRIADVTFDWTAPATVHEYMLITRKNDAPVLVPQNILFTNDLNVASGGFGSYFVRFGVELENGASLEFRRIRQMRIYRTFLWKHNSESSWIKGNGVEIELKTGDTMKEDLEISYYGSGSLRYPSPLGVPDLAAGDWITLQYVGAATEEDGAQGEL